MSKWIIRDWMSNDCNLFGKTEFDSFGSARDEIQRFADSLTKDEDRQEGICEDLYAINVDDNGEELPDEGQYTV